MKILKKILVVIILLIIMPMVLFIPPYIAIHPFMTDNKCKEYIIEHESEIRIYDWDTTNVYRKIDSCEYDYYTDITIVKTDDSSYNVIFWGDRDSWKWDFKKDKYFTIDIPYKRHNGEDVELDIKLIEILNSKI